MAVWRSRTAGTSTESGIPDFRSASGIWAQYDPYEVASIDGFRRDPDRVWEFYSRRLDVLQHKIDVLKDHCHDVGRDYATIRKTYTLTCYLSHDRDAAERRAGAALERENPAFAGDPAGLRDHLNQLADLGFDLFQLVFPNFPETDDMEMFVDEVLPHFR